MAAAITPSARTHKPLLPDCLTGSRACNLYNHGDSSACYGVTFARSSLCTDRLRLRTSEHRSICMSREPKVSEVAASLVTEDSWDKSILRSECPVLVEFYASWCGPCRMVHEVLDELAWEYEGKIKCYLLNTDQDLQIARDYNIKAVPVVMVFKGGARCESLVGTLPKSTYEAAIRRAMDS